MVRSWKLLTNKISLKLNPNESQHEFRFFENGCGTDFLDVQMFGSWLNEQGDNFQLQFKNFAFPGQYSGWFQNWWPWIGSLIYYFWMSKDSVHINMETLKDLTLECDIELCQKDQNCATLLPQPSCPWIYSAIDHWC